MNIVGIGIDITEVNRLRQAVQRWGDDFLKRIFTAKELENAKTRGNLYQHLAGRFAVKEAVFKALGNRELGWKDIQVFNDEEGKPKCVILDSLKSRNCEVIVSISHVKNYAVANAIVAKKT